MTAETIGFALVPLALRDFARKRGRVGGWLIAVAILGLLFGMFWLFWSLILLITGLSMRNGLIVFLLGGVGPTLASLLIAWAGVRRRRDAEELGELGVYAETQADFILSEAAHLLRVPESRANQLMQLATRAGCAKLVQSSGLRAALPMGPERQRLIAFRRTRRWRALLLALAALPVLGFGALFVVIGVAGIATGEGIIAVVLLVPGGLFPLAAAIFLASRALSNWRRAARAARLSAVVSASGVHSIEQLAQRLELPVADTRSVAVEALRQEIVPRDRLAQVLEPSAPGAPRTPQPAQMSGWVGRTINGVWRVDALLAQGGMGAVFRATHLSSGTAYALKIMLPDLANSADALARFEQEAHAASQLGHPGIVTTHELGRIDERTAYIVMDLLEGESLEARLQRVGCLPWQDAVRIAQEIGEALSCAHDAGLLHRDLKPANVFLARAAQGERAMLLDFGLVKNLDPSHESRRTTSGVVAGTPLYMSPEQARGEPLDVRSDLYGLAVVTYEMIAGVPPFFDKTVAEVYARLLREAAPALGQVAPSGYPAELEQVLARALSTDREQRPARVAELLQQLSALLPPPRAVAG